MRCSPHNFVGVGVPWGATPTPAIVQSGTPDAGYPFTALYDGQTSPVCRWADLAADYYLDVGLNVVPDGDGEQATVPAAWVVSGGALARASGGVGPYKGTYYLSLTPSGQGEASAHCDVTVPAGSYWRFCVATAGAGGGRIARVAVLDMERGGTYYLAADGTWTTSPTWLGETGVAAWTATAVEEFRVPTFAEWGRRSGTLRIVLQSPAHGVSAEAVAFDEVLLFPSKLDLLAFAGHNLPAQSRVRVSTFADYWHGGAETVVWDAAGRMPQPTGFLYMPAAPITDPYVRITVSLPNGGSAFRYPQIAELWLGRTLALPRSVRPGWQTEWREDQLRQRTRGALFASRDLHYPVRKFPIQMDLVGGTNPETEWALLRDEVMAPTGMGADPCVLLPAYDVEPDWCVFGNFVDTLRLTRTLPHLELGWEFEELPVPLVG